MEALFTLLDRLAQDPVRHGFQNLRGHRLLDLCVFGYQSSLAGLEEMVELRERLDRCVVVSACLQTGANQVEVFLGGDL